MNIRPLVALGALFLAPLAAAQPADPPGSLAAALGEGDIALQFRYRYESVEQDNALDDAGASTLRSRLGYTSLDWKGWQLQLEADAISAIGDEDYNSTGNGESAYSVVADPEGSEFNQAWIAYSGFDKTLLKYGRQRILLDNERFVGGVGWRQNEQTFDGGSLVNRSLPQTTLSYAWIHNVNRVFGPDDGTQEAWKADWDAAVHLLNLSYAGLPLGTITVYEYLMDFADAEQQSNQTLGIRFSGKRVLCEPVALSYSIEYARQQDYANSPEDWDADYWLLEAGLVLPAGLTLSLGQEVLGGDARNPGRAFRTPLATGHKFQGFADLFLATPAGGIEDRYAGAALVFDGFTAAVVWHVFEAEDSDASYGEEIDASLSRKFGKHLSALLKYADYREDGFGVDTRKAWLQLQLDF